MAENSVSNDDGKDNQLTEENSPDVQLLSENEGPVLKLHVNGVDKYVTAKKFEKELAKYNVFPLRIRKAPKAIWAVLTFKDIETRDSAIPLINSIVFNGRTLAAKVHDAARLAADRTESSGKRKFEDAKLEKDDRVSKPRPTDVRQVATPLYEMPYEEQLKLKQSNMAKDCIVKATRRVRGSFKKRDSFFKNHKKEDGSAHQSAARSEMPSWVNAQGKGISPITMRDIRPSPTTEGYRNKCDFTIAFGEDEAPAIGFCLGRRDDGTMIVGSPEHCSNVSSEMKRLVVEMDKFVRASPFEPYKPANHNSCWRSMVIRRSEITNDSMIVLTVTTARLDPALWAQEKARLIQDIGPMVSSLFICVYDGVSTADPDHPVEHLSGKDHIIEVLFDSLRFKIVPGSFFQTNTKACEVLYSTVLELAALEEGATFLDVCCGTGAIGICAAAQSKVPISVVGVELAESSVKCAKENATLNNIENTSFICSRAELVLGDMLRSKTKDRGKVVAVVDPPRSGLHRSCLEALRNCPAIDRLVYVSCNPTGSMVSDIEVLCGPSSKTLPGASFVPDVATPIDLFPSTEHCEMIIAFNR